MIITVLMPMALMRSKRSRIPGLTTSLSWMTPSTPRVEEATTSGVPPSRPRDRRGPSIPHGVREARASAPTAARNLCAPLRSCSPGGINAAHAGFRRERHADHILRHPIQGHAEGVPQFDDGTAFRSFVAGGGKAGGLHHFIDIHAGQRQERRGHAVAERDRPGLVEQQHIHVPGGLHRAADRAARYAGADGPSRRCRWPRAGR